MRRDGLPSTSRGRGCSGRLSATHPGTIYSTEATYVKALLALNGSRFLEAIILDLAQAERFFAPTPLHRKG
jgi:hypothetical protein